jgi:hypothetical protein
MSVTQLSPSIPVYVTSKGHAFGYAIGWIDYGEQHSLIWIVAMNDSKEVWCLRNEDIRLTENITMDYK